MYEVGFCDGQLRVVTSSFGQSHEGDKPKRGGKRKERPGTSESVELPKRAKKLVQKPRSPSPIIQQESKERTRFFITSCKILSTTSSVSIPPEVPIIKYILEEIQTSGISGSTYDVGPNATIGVTFE
uniref:Uncharacterized protein n=1 Tax=Lactuca sativa TaxID=4236 RepID=A0A9R1UYE2_LACSA|nr:hypothetical protein LSAT_V11C700373810 [Lactuca sativa]